MSEQKSNGCFKALMVFVGISVLFTLALSAGGYYVWKKKGSPSWKELQAKMENAAEETAEEEESTNGIVLQSRPVVASAPIPAGPDTYAQYVKRKDVLTLVNYYSDT